MGIFVLLPISLTLDFAVSALSASPPTPPHRTRTSGGMPRLYGAKTWGMRGRKRADGRETFALRRQRDREWAHAAPLRAFRGWRACGIEWRWLSRP